LILLINNRKERAQAIVSFAAKQIKDNAMLVHHEQGELERYGHIYMRLYARKGYKYIKIIGGGHYEEMHHSHHGSAL
jgi:hypothetical protein